MRNRLVECVGCTDAADGFLPEVSPDDPTSKDIPFVGLLNSVSGNKAGTKILNEAQNWPVYKARLFDICKVASNSEVADAFAEQLDQAKAEAAQKDPKPVRPRLLVGGGDGTASFALWCVFRALRGKDGKMRWSDEELNLFFPAIVQMPLGTGNDFAGVLGWGRTIDPVHDRSGTRTWFKNAFSPRCIVRGLDAWGLFPNKQSCMKVCKLEKMDERFDRPAFKTAGPGSPFLSLLYFSLGYEAYVAAQVEVNRTASQFGNKIAYSKAAVGSLIGARRVNLDLTGITISVPEDEGDGFRQYCPPTHRFSTGEEFTSVGFMNINSYSAGYFAAKDVAMFSDGKMDLFRQKHPARNALKRGLRWRTEKHSRAKFHVPPSLPGSFFQYDGEAEFMFNPHGGGVDFDIRQVLRIPVVIGQQLEFRKGLDPHPLDAELPAFHVTGSETDKAQFWERMELWITGKVSEELIASPEEVERLQANSARFLQGECSRSQRIMTEFGPTVFTYKCTKCGAQVPNKGCKGCQRRFCHTCLTSHVGSAPQVQWMYKDVFLPDLARLDPLRWSSRLCLGDVISEMEHEKTSRPILAKILVASQPEELKSFANSAVAMEWLRSFREEDDAAASFKSEDSNLSSDVEDGMRTTCSRGSQVSV